MFKVQVGNPRSKPDATQCFDCKPTILFVAAQLILFCLHVKVSAKNTLKTQTKSWPHVSGQNQTLYETSCHF